MQSQVTAGSGNCDIIRGEQRRGLGWSIVRTELRQPLQGQDVWLGVLGQQLVDLPLRVEYLSTDASYEWIERVEECHVFSSLLNYLNYKAP